MGAIHNPAIGFGDKVYSDGDLAQVWHPSEMQPVKMFRLSPDCDSHCANFQRCGAYICTQA